MNTERDFKTRLDALVSKIAGAGFGRSEAERVADNLTAAGAVNDDSLLHIVTDLRSAESLRLDACWLLPRMGIQRAEETLISLLNDPVEGIRAEAASGLGLLPRDSVVQPLLFCLENDRAKPVRLAVIHALGILSREASAPHLLRIVQNTQEDEEVRADAVEALAHVNSESVVDWLVAALQDPSALVRYSAAYALGEQRNRRALPALREVASKDPGITKYGRVATCAEEAVATIVNRDF